MLTRPSPALQPMSGGKAPATAPISVLQTDQRLAGVYHARYETSVSSVNSAARRSTRPKSRNRATTHISAPRTNAEPVGTLPVGMGRSAVRAIRASVSCSSHWFSTATPPAASAVPTSSQQTSARSDAGLAA